MANIVEYTQVHTLQKLKARLPEYTTLVRGEPHWWTSYIEYSEQNIDSLLGALVQLRSVVPFEQASFRDYGSGDGVTAVLASIAGFNPVSGIELNQTFFANARNLVKYLSLEQQVQFVNGTYYSDSASQYIPEAAEYLKSQYELDCFDEVNFNSYLCQLLQVEGSDPYETISNYLFPNSNVAYGSRFEMADVSYIFPSDMCFETVLVSQLRAEMLSGQYLAIVGTDNDRLKRVDELARVQEIRFNIEDVSMVIDVFTHP